MFEMNHLNMEEVRTGHDVEISRNIMTQEQIDRLSAKDGSSQTKSGRSLRSRCSYLAQCEYWKGLLFRIFPVLRWLPQYKVRQDLVSDLIAGITVGIMHIPQGMAYASLAGLPPVYGLYTSFFPTLIYFLMGTSGHVSVGTFAVASLMVGGVRYRFVPETDAEKTVDLTSSNGTALATVQSTFEGPDHVNVTLSAIEVTTSLTLLVGIIQVGMAILRMGFLTVFLSDQLVSGFTTGAAVMVFTAQVNKVLGVKLPRHEGVGKLYYTYRDIILAIPETNYITLIISLLCIALIYATKEFLNPKFKRRFKIPIPVDLFVVGFVIISLLCIALIYATKAFLNPKFKRRFKIPIPIDLFWLVLSSHSSALPSSTRRRRSSTRSSRGGSKYLFLSTSFG